MTSSATDHAVRPKNAKIMHNTSTTEMHAPIARGTLTRVSSRCTG